MWVELGVFSAMWLWKADERKPRRPHIGHIGRPRRLRKTSPLRKSSSQSSGVKTDALTIVPQDPCLRRILLSYSLSELAAKGWGLVWIAVAKKQFFASWKIAFSAPPLWAPETIFQALKTCFIAFPPERRNGMNPSLRGLQGSSQALRFFFHDLKHCFFGTALVKLIDTRLCKKTGSDFFFACPLLNLHKSFQLHLVTSFKLAPNSADAYNT
jgi:hypothetical protein